MTHQIEILREIWPDDGDGERIEVGPDRDGLGLVEIRIVERNREISNRISMDRSAAQLVAKAMLLCADELTKETDQ